MVSRCRNGSNFFPSCVRLCVQLFGRALARPGVLRALLCTVFRSFLNFAQLSLYRFFLFRFSLGQYFASGILCSEHAFAAFPCRLGFFLFKHFIAWIVLLHSCRRKLTWKPTWVELSMGWEGLPTTDLRAETCVCLEQLAALAWSAAQIDEARPVHGVGG